MEKLPSQLLTALASLSPLSPHTAGVLARLALVWEVGNQGVLLLRPFLRDMKPFCSSGLSFPTSQLRLGPWPFVKCLAICKIALLAAPKCWL